MWSIINNPWTPCPRIILILFLTYAALRFTGKLMTDLPAQANRPEKGADFEQTGSNPSPATPSTSSPPSPCRLISASIRRPSRPAGSWAGHRVRCPEPGSRFDFRFLHHLEDQMEVGDYVR